VLQRQFQSTPSGGKATLYCRVHCLDSMFQSTPSGGKATMPRGARRQQCVVSIHAFRGEGDDSGTSTRMHQIHVSIHAFRGEGDLVLPGALPRQHVSIHAFRGEGDLVN